MSTNTLPAFPALRDGVVSLPLHVMDTVTHACIHCGDTPIWDSFEEYVAHWLEFEYEGDRYHTHDEREEFDYFASTCLATA